MTIASDAVGRPGTQLVFVYVGSSRCAPSNAPEVAPAVREGQRLLQKRAREAGIGFVSIGVAREADPYAGIEHLASVGRFDELSTGQGKMNQGSAHFISRELVGVGATPQIIVVEREILDQGGGYFDPSKVRERVLLRRVGRREISTWEKLGYPIPEPTTGLQRTIDALGQAAPH